MADWSALGNMVSGMIPLYAKEGSQAYNYGQQVNSAFQEQQIQEAVRQEAKKREKAKKGKLFGSIGSALGTIGGVALAPLTGGTSLAIPAALGAAGSVVGGAAGTLAGGGKLEGADVLTNLGTGAVGGLTAGMLGGFNATHGAVKAGLLDTSISGVANSTPGAMAGAALATQLPAGAAQALSGMRSSGTVPSSFGGGFQAGIDSKYGMGGAANRGGATPLKKFRYDPETGIYEWVPGGGY